MERLYNTDDILRIFNSPGKLFQINSFKKLLVKGEWIAWGIKVPASIESEREKIPAHLWEFLDLDWIGKRAHANGIEFIALKFSRAVPRKVPGRPSQKEHSLQFYYSIKGDIIEQEEILSKSEIAKRIRTLYQQNHALETPDKRTIENHIHQEYEELKSFFDNERNKHKK